ncbi:uncharacterized protein [Cherax quadricarinatus]|uniref:uncharacterized protein isoform X2 n=1 Tax=Cherax quadricarinatus TaxID=27406 RepID=UPI002378FC0E|nr:uncharacterized protein LOC128693949 isoform X2 [Cherax quadricarinatus]
MSDKLRYLAIILLVLLFVVSAMGGSNSRYRFFASASTSGVCLSFRHSKNITDCCNGDDHLQRFYVTKTGRSTGVFHSMNLNKILCYDDNKGRFKLVKRKYLRVDQCRHMRSKRRHRREARRPSKKPPVCPFSNRDKEILQNPKGNLRCVLHETQGGSGYTYISVENNAKYLGVRAGRVQKLLSKRNSRREPREKNRQFMVMSQGDMFKISNALCER